MVVQDWPTRIGRQSWHASHRHVRDGPGLEATRPTTREGQPMTTGRRRFPRPSRASFSRTSSVSERRRSFPALSTTEVLGGPRRDDRRGPSYVCAGERMDHHQLRAAGPTRRQARLSTLEGPARPEIAPAASSTSGWPTSRAVYAGVGARAAREFLTKPESSTQKPRSAATYRESRRSPHRRSARPQAVPLGRRAARVDPPPECGANLGSPTNEEDAPMSSTDVPERVEHDARKPS